MSFIIPFPDTFLAAVWFAIGLTFGRGFGKNLDQNIQNSTWFKQQRPVVQWVLSRILNVTHHWWIGALLMLYPAVIQEIYWFGFGLLIDDLPDVPARLKQYFSYWIKEK